MALRYLRQDRSLALRGSILLTDGTTHALSADNIVRYHIDESSTGGEAITIGDTRAAEYRLEIADAAHTLTAAQLLGACVTMEIGLDGLYDPLGVWYISRVRISRQSATVDISGADALSNKADDLYKDGTYPATLGQIAQRAAEHAGLTLKSAGFRNSGVYVASAPEWNKDTNSIRAVIGYVAGCAGGFARMDRDGLLEIVEYNEDTIPETVSADYFATLNVGMGRSFAFNCLQVMHYGTNIYTRYAVNDAAEDTAGNTLRISDNPLMTADIARSLVSALTGMTGQAISADWVGDPTVMTGDVLTFVDTDDAQYPGIVTGQTIEIDGGLHMTTDADLPERISATYATDTLYTPSGRVNITAIEGRIKVWAQNEITLQVGSATDALQTQINAVPGQITAAVGNVQIGGTNLIRETGWYDEVAPGWTVGGSDVFIRYPSGGNKIDAFEGNGYIHWNAPSVQGELYTPIFSMQGGEEYTVSFRHRGGDMTVVWLGYDSAGTHVWGGQLTAVDYTANDRAWTLTTGENVTSAQLIFRTGTGVSGVLGRIKAEKGNKATAWSPHPMDNSRGVVNGSALRITQEAVNINTPVFGVNVSGTNGDMSISEHGMSINKINSPSVRAQYDGPTSLYVTGTANGTNNFVSLADVFALLSNRHLPKDVSISVERTYVDSGAVLQNVTGSSITIHGYSHTITGTIKLTDVSNRVLIDNLHVSHGSVTPWALHNCAFVHMEWCIINANRGVTEYVSGIQLQRGTTLDINACTISNAYGAIDAIYGCRISMSSCKGNNNVYAVIVKNMSTLGMIGSRPAAAGGIYKDASCWVSTDPGANDSGSTSAPSNTTTVTLTATNSRTYGGGWYSGTNVLSQGVSGGTTFYGYMWFDRTPIKGKSIKSASIRLYRRAGVGRGVPVSVYVGVHKASEPSGSTNIVASYNNAIGLVDQKETLTVSIPTEAAQHLANGTGLGLFIHSTSSGYAQFDGYGDANPPQLTVTY